MIKKYKIPVFIAIFALISSCETKSSLILGKWKLHHIESKNSETVITFFTKNVFTKVYYVKNKIHTEIKDNGKWKYDEELNIIELIHSDEITSERYRIELLNKDSLIWSPLDSQSLNLNNRDFFIRED